MENIDGFIEDCIKKGITLYAVTDGNVVIYNKIKCNFTGKQCSTNCVLYNPDNKTCGYSDSLGKKDSRGLSILDSNLRSHLEKLERR